MDWTAYRPYAGNAGAAVPSAQDVGDAGAAGVSAVVGRLGARGVPAHVLSVPRALVRRQASRAFGQTNVTDRQALKWLRDKLSDIRVSTRWGAVPGSFFGATGDGAGGGGDARWDPDTESPDPARRLASRLVWELSGHEGADPVHDLHWEQWHELRAKGGLLRVTAVDRPRGEPQPVRWWAADDGNPVLGHVWVAGTNRSRDWADYMADGELARELEERLVRGSARGRLSKKARDFIDAVNVVFRAAMASGEERGAMAMDRGLNVGEWPRVIEGSRSYYPFESDAPWAPIAWQIGPHVWYRVLPETYHVTARRAPWTLPPPPVYATRPPSPPLSAAGTQSPHTDDWTQPTADWTPPPSPPPRSATRTPPPSPPTDEWTPSPPRPRFDPNATAFIREQIREQAELLQEAQKSLNRIRDNLPIDEPLSQELAMGYQDAEQTVADIQDRLDETSENPNETVAIVNTTASQALLDWLFDFEDQVVRTDDQYNDGSVSNADPVTPRTGSDAAPVTPRPGSGGPVTPQAGSGDLDAVIRTLTEVWESDASLLLADSDDVEPPIPGSRAHSTDVQPTPSSDASLLLTDSDDAEPPIPGSRAHSTNVPPPGVSVRMTDETANSTEEDDFTRVPPGSLFTPMPPPPDPSTLPPPGVQPNFRGEKWINAENKWFNSTRIAWLLMRYVIPVTRQVLILAMDTGDAVPDKTRPLLNSLTEAEHWVVEYLIEMERVPTQLPSSDVVSHLVYLSYAFAGMINGVVHYAIYKMQDAAQRQTLLEGVFDELVRLLSGSEKFSVHLMEVYSKTLQGLEKSLQRDQDLKDLIHSVLRSDHSPEDWDSEDTSVFLDLMNSFTLNTFGTFRRILSALYEPFRPKKPSDVGLEVNYDTESQSVAGIFESDGRGPRPPKMAHYSLTEQTNDPALVGTIHRYISDILPPGLLFVTGSGKEEEDEKRPFAQRPSRQVALPPAVVWSGKEEEDSTDQGAVIPPPSPPPPPGPMTTGFGPGPGASDARSLSRATLSRRRAAISGEEEKNSDGDDFDGDNPDDSREPLGPTVLFQEVPPPGARAGGGVPPPPPPPPPDVFAPIKGGPLDESDLRRRIDAGRSALQPVQPPPEEPDRGQAAGVFNIPLLNRAAVRGGAIAHSPESQAVGKDEWDD